MAVSIITDMFHNLQLKIWTQVISFSNDDVRYNLDLTWYIGSALKSIQPDFATYIVSLWKMRLRLKVDKSNSKINILCF